MKNLFILIFSFTSVFAFSQHATRQFHEFNLSTQNALIGNFEKALSNDTTFDVKFYHIDVDIAIDSIYIQGNVNYLMVSQINDLNHIELDLDDAYIIDSISFPAESYSFNNNVIIINFNTSYDIDESFTFAIYYHGQPQLAGGYKGLRYETHDGTQPIIASLSTPFLAHTWWPCKDGTEDKSDSTFIDITIKDTIINSLQMIALSNGLLESVETENGNKTFKWKHYYPIVPYYVMVAISNYEHFQQVYTGSDYSFPIDYYVFSSHLSEAQNGVAQMPDAIAFFTSIFGPYPFLNEKYGMTQLGYYGAIENQTNTITNNMSLSWFYISVHELAHQWFADMITCKTWHHGWLNEGFATYSEALYKEHVEDFEAYQDYMSSLEYYSGGTIYLDDISDPFNIFRAIIYNKGAYVLHMLRGIVGDDDFFEIIHTYATDPNYTYKHATTEDFQLICESISGKDLQYFFEQWIYDEYYPRYRYNYIFQESTGNLALTIAQSQENLGWRPVFSMPMEIKIEFVDGTDTIVNVFNESQSHTYTFQLNKNVADITLDPNKWILRTTTYDPEIIIKTEELDDAFLAVYPNPNNGNFFISLPSNKTNSHVQVMIKDLNGKSHYSSVFSSNESNIHIQQNMLDAGVYVLEVLMENKKYYKRILIVK